MSMLDDTVKTTKKTLEETRDNAEQAAGRARSTLVDGLHAAASVVTMIRGLGLADALGWVGLQRARGPLVPVMSFGAGFLTGAAAGVLFAPRSGVEMRRWLVQQALGMEHRAEETVAQVQTKVADKAGEIAGDAKGAVHHAGDKAAELADKAKHAAGDLADRARDTAHKAEDRLAQGAGAVKDAVKVTFDDLSGNGNGTKPREGTKPLTPGHHSS